MTTFTSIKSSVRRMDEKIAGKLAERRSSSGRPTAPAASPHASLPPTTALRENGFTVFRGLFPKDECARLTSVLKSEAGLEPGAKLNKVDVTNTYPSARDVLLEGRIVDAVRSALGSDPRFLQVGDLQHSHDTAGWHRDSVHRAKDASSAPDWREGSAPFGVVKAILYLESDNAAMGIIAGSHLSPVEADLGRITRIENAGGQLVVDAGDNPNRRFTPAEKELPMAWRAQVGDVLVFDERMYHAGRRVDDGSVHTDRAAAKFTLSLVFGRDNEHSERMYSYFRYVRSELGYQDLSADLLAELAERDLVLSNGWGDFYARHPEDLEHVWLRNADQLSTLREKYTAAAAGS